MDIKEIVENAMSEAESKYPPSDIENALENVLKRAENTAPGEERAAVRANAAAGTNVRTGDHKIIKALAGIAAVAAVLAGAFFGAKYLKDNNIELLKEGGGNMTVTGTNEPAVTAAPVTKDEEITTSKTTALSDKITEIKKKIAEKKAGIENAETEKNAYSKKAEDANNSLNALAETLVNLRALDETPEILQEIKGIEADIDYYSEIKAAYDDEISVLDDHIDRLKQELSVLEQELLEAERSRDAETESTTETSAEITTNALLYETEAETTEPAEVSPTDDELKALVKQGAEACGLKITVSDLTKASLKLNYYCEGDNSKYLAFMWGGKYEIQILSGNEWMTYDPDNFRRWNDEQMWFDSSFSINEFPDHSDEHETILFYGDNMYESEIPKGNYRVLKQIAVYGNGKNLGQLTAYAEFTIDEHTPNVFGITMTAKNVSPESVTLAVQQSGASFHVKRNLGYKARFVLERKTGSGEWKKVDGNPVTWAPDIEPINENGITEIKEDFSDIYGSLPDGTYRISKLFVNYVGTGETKDDILNSSTYYSTEFTLQDNVWYVTEVNAFGVSVAVKDVTTEGLTLVTKHDGTTLKSDVLCDQSRYVERMNDSGEWEEYLTMYIDAEERKLDVGKTFEEHITLSYDDDDILRPGKYRIRRVFNSFDNEAVCYANFEITDKTPNDWGIWAETEEVTADSITLIIHRENVKGLTDDMFPAISYYIEKRSENMIPDDWEKLEFLPGKEPINKYSDLELKTGAKERMRFDWKGVFGTLSAGEYRLKLKYKCGEKTKDCCFIFIIN